MEVVASSEAGYVHLRNVQTGLNVRNAGCEDVSDETPVELWDGTGNCARWRLEAVGDYGATASVLSEATRAPALTSAPAEYALAGAYPNPFNPTTAIRFALPEGTDVRLEVFDVTGRRVALLVDGAVSAGHHEASFEASRLPSGLYLYRLEATGASGAFAETGKMTLLK